MGVGVTEKELAELLRNNPDLVLAIDGERKMTTPGSDYIALVRDGKAGMQMSEHELQTEVIRECDRRSVLRAEYGMIFAIPNGGQRHPAVAAKLKAEGVRAGVPDLFLPVARQGYHGLFIELKCGGHKPSEAQLTWIRNLRAEGYLCHVVWDSVDEVMGLIETYLEGK